MGVETQSKTGVIAAIILFCSCGMVSLGLVELIFLVVNIPVFFALFLIELYRKSTTPFQNIGVTILGLIYVVLPFSILTFITTISGTYNYEVLFGIFFILWSNDTGAYLAGSAFGKNKLLPRISPGKTWEGTIGGVVLGFIVAYVISGLFTSLLLLDWLFIAAILTVIGSMGDLVESLFKRSINVKDSGNILPGHGGILDRFDSLIVSIPFIIFYLVFMKPFLYLIVQ
jgi:phosphatidate cytidylyltransferase